MKIQKLHLGKMTSDGMLIFCGHKYTKAYNENNDNAFDNIVGIKEFRTLQKENQCAFCRKIAIKHKLIKLQKKIPLRNKLFVV